MAFSFDGHEFSDLEAGKLFILASRLSPEEIGMLLMLTERNLKNPILTFKDREKNGDFDELRENEDPLNLRPMREPMCDIQFEDAKQSVLEQGEFWAKKPEISGLKLLWRMTDGFDEEAIMALCRMAADARRGVLATILSVEEVPEYVPEAAQDQPEDGDYYEDAGEECPEGEVPFDVPEAEYGYFGCEDGAECYYPETEFPEEAEFEGYDPEDGCD